MGINFADLGKQRELDKHILYLVISGDKSFGHDSSFIMSVNGKDEMINGDVLLEALVNKMVRKRLASGFSIDVRHGNNTGVDSLVEAYCERHGVIHHQHKPNWDKGGASAGYTMCEDLYLFPSLKPNNGSLLLWDGENKYTRYMIFCASMYRVPVRVYNYITKEWLTSDEISSIQEDIRADQARRGRWV